MPLMFLTCVIDRPQDSKIKIDICHKKKHRIHKRFWFTLIQIRVLFFIAQKERHPFFSLFKPAK